MKYFKRVFFWGLLTLFFIFPIVFVFLVLERVPMVSDVEVMNTDNAVKTRAFAKQVLQQFLQENDRPILISATEDELNGAFSIAHRSVRRARGRAVISAQGLELSGTFRLPQNPFGNYINVELILSPSAQGFHIAQAKLGTISLSDASARFLMRLGLDLIFGQGEGEYLLDAVKSVRLSDKRIDVDLKPIPRMNQLVQQMRGRIRVVRDEVRPMGDPAGVRVYYRRIMALSEYAPRDEALSLAYYISRLFKIASQTGEDAADENRSAILALGIYFGSWRVEQMIGTVRTTEMLAHERLTKGVGLAGRRDLRLHFIISAALEIAAKSGVSHAIGEFKELYDARRGGSGFSFADLAADRAGVRFAEVATDPKMAGLIQRRLSENEAETQFFPDISALPEGLSQARFEAYFVNVEGTRYLALVDEMDACLSRLPAYVLENHPAETSVCDIRSAVPAALLS
ncbi:MAG: hypothetical protein VST69_05750 [Nitrospirota bacterium]|nr:hypothetical protein [Nitrospirota bacterium]